jgi:serine/threonine protein phosphatase PrpC
VHRVALRSKKNLHKGPKEQAVTAWPDINTLELGGADHEFMILACDGIWEILSNQQAVDFVRERLRRPNTGVKRSTDGAAAPRCDEHQVSVARLSEIGAEMCDHCLADDTDSDCLGTDNMTVMIVLLSASSVREGPARDGAATPDIGAESKAGSVESREEKKRRLDID